MIVLARLRDLGDLGGPTEHLQVLDALGEQGRSRLERLGKRGASAYSSEGRGAATARARVGRAWARSRQWSRPSRSVRQGVRACVCAKYVVSAVLTRYGAACVGVWTWMSWQPGHAERDRGGELEERPMAAAETAE